MSDIASVQAPQASLESVGVIHDIGYQRYDGPRLGRAYSFRSLYAHGVRTAFGLGRSAGSKVFPWSVFALVMVVAAILAAIRSQTGEMPVTYWGFPAPISLLIILFCAVITPELVSRDIRGGVLPLYFSRPLTRSDYALAKWAALVTSIAILLVSPMLLMFLGGAFTVDGLSAVWTEFVQFSKGVAIAGVYAIVFASLSIVVSALAGRRAVAAALVVALFLVTTPVYGVLMGVAYSGSQDGVLTGSDLVLSQVAGLVSPMILVDGVGNWLFNPDQPYGDYGPLYGGVALALTVIALLLLLLRYRKVAR
jgi:ABC-2 type transport system permease protein